IICESCGCSFHHPLTLVQHDHHYFKSLQNSEGTWCQSPPCPQIAPFQPQQPSWISRHDFAAPNNRTTAYCTPPLSPYCEHARALPLSLFSQIHSLSPLLIPLNGHCISLFTITPCSGLHHSKAGDTAGWA
ncbi:hypothetical protein K443DRAFT_114458, partial [Laccaria amethystina LaAM-08-1]